MAFTLFNFIGSLSRSNSRFFGFQTFSLSFFRTLELGFECYANCHYKKTGINLHSTSLREIFESIKSYYRRQNDVSQLQNNHLWDRFKEGAGHNVVLQKQLTEMRSEFQQVEIFAGYSHESLLEAYKNLRRIERLLGLARRDLLRAAKRKIFGRIPDYLLQEYNQYITEQLKIAKAEREAMIHNIFIRLVQVSKDPFLENADMVYRHTEVLKQKGFLNAGYTAPQLNGDVLSPKLFHQFHAIVWRYGDKDVREHMQYLPWFRKHKTVGERFGLEYLIPQKHKIPNFLYFNANLRCHWFDNFYPYAKLEVSLSYLKSVFTAEALSADTFAKCMLCSYSAEMILRDEFERMRLARLACQKGLRKYFCRDTLSFLDGLERQLKKQRIKLLEQKINLLRYISVAPRSEIESLNIARFIDAIKNEVMSINYSRLHDKFNGVTSTLEEKISIYYEEYLRRYLLQWSNASRQAQLSLMGLDKLHQEAEEQEALLLNMLSLPWQREIRHLQQLRRSEQFSRLENRSRMLCDRLLLERPVVKHTLIREYFKYLYDALNEYIKNHVEGFDYVDQKKVLLDLILRLEKQSICEIECSAELSVAERQFLKTFPQINFFINVMLKLRQEEKIMNILSNMHEMEVRINSVCHFIKHQEKKFLKPDKAKFMALYSAEGHVFQCLGRAIR